MNCGRFALRGICSPKKLISKLLLRTLFASILYYCLSLIWNGTAVYVLRGISNRSYVEFSSSSDEYLTAKGIVTIRDIERDVFQWYGYLMETATKGGIPVLRRTIKETCDLILENWLTKNPKTYTTEPGELLHPDFTMNGYAKIFKCNAKQRNKKVFYGNGTLDISENWDKQVVKDNKLARRNNGKFTEAFPDSVSLYYAFKNYSIKDKIGAIMNSVSPLIENLCRSNNPKRVVRIGTCQKTVYKCAQTSLTRPLDIIKDTPAYRHVFDFVLSYSGMERIGLGRDDEDLDHFGDINEMRRIGCLLKPGGFLFLRLPLGHDQITTNCYRVYGRIRLALLIEGFELLDIYYGNNTRPLTMKLRPFNHKFNDRMFDYYTMVLRKK